MNHLLGATVVAALLSAAAPDMSFGQSTASAQPTFDVASVKECTGTEKPPPSISSPGRLSLGCWPLWRLIADAYVTFSSGKVDPLNLPVPRPIEGGPAWVNSARYSVDAKTEAPQTGAMMRGPLMQALLEDRFQLKIHRETREVSGYNMTVAQGGPKLRSTAEGSCNHVDPTDLTPQPNTNTGDKPWCLNATVKRTGPTQVFDVHGMTLDVFSKLLHPDGLPVFDKTGLTGAFDIHLEWELDAANTPIPDSGVASDPSPHISAIVAMRQQLGLRLDHGKGPIELLVIDRVEKPSQN
ncbi:MAG: peptidase BlaR1 [Candidatus Solibacter sp.]|nr:peptidase BlaR1 [Candidatus Solibacter sp.]